MSLNLSINRREDNKSQLFHSIVDVNEDLRSSLESLHKSEEKIRSEVLEIMEQGLREGNIKIKDMIKNKELAKLHLNSYDIHQMISKVELSQLEQIIDETQKRIKVFDHTTDLDRRIAKIHTKLIHLNEKRISKLQENELRIMNRIRNGGEIDPNKVHFKEHKPEDSFKILPFYAYKKHRAKLIKSANVAYIKQYVHAPKVRESQKEKLKNSKSGSSKRNQTEESKSNKRRNAVITHHTGNQEAEKPEFQDFTDDLNQLWEEEENQDWEIKRLREKWGSAYNCRQYLMSMRRKNPNYYEEKKIVKAIKSDNEGKNYIVLTPHNYGNIQMRKKNNDFIHPTSQNVINPSYLHPNNFIDIPSRSSSEVSQKNSSRSKKKIPKFDNTHVAVINPRRENFGIDYKLNTFAQTLATESKAIPKVIIEKVKTDSFRKEFTDTFDFQLPAEAQGIKNHNSFITSKDRLKENRQMYHDKHIKNMEKYKKFMHAKYSQPDNAYGAPQDDGYYEAMNSSMKTPKTNPTYRLNSTGGVTMYASTRKPSSSMNDSSYRYNARLNKTISPARSNRYESPSIPESPHNYQDLKYFNQKLDQFNLTIDDFKSQTPVSKQDIEKIGNKNMKYLEKIDDVYEKVSRLREYDPHILQLVYRYNQADERDRAEEVEEMVDRVRDFSLTLSPAIINFQKRVFRTQYKNAMQKKMDIKFGKEYN